MKHVLHLADGRSWGIRPCGKTRPWASEFARVMGLEEYSGIPDAVLRLHEVGPFSGRGNPPWWRPPEEYSAVGWRVRLSPGLEIWHHPDVQETIVGIGNYRDRESIILQMRFSLYPIYEDTVLRGGLPLHAALLEHEGRAILLAGRSGVGKSTACHRVPPPWRVLGDDLALIVRNAGGHFYAHALPTWSAIRADREDRTLRVSYSVPLAAVFFLIQADKDEVVRQGQGTAAVMLDSCAVMVFRSVNSYTDPIDRSPLRKEIFASSALLASSIPCFVLRLSLQGRFWEKIEEVLGQLKQPRGEFNLETVAGIGAFDRMTDCDSVSRDRK